MADSAELPDSIAEPSESDEESEFASEMKIFVQSEAVHSYVLLVDGSNTVEDVLVKILGSDRAGRAPEPRLYFDDSELEKQKTLAEYGIKFGSVLHLKCTPRVLAHAHDPAELAKMDCADSGSSVRSNPDGEMKIFVQSKYRGNYALEVDRSNTVWDVLATIIFTNILFTKRLESQPEPELYFNGRKLEMAESLAAYSIQDCSILQLECTDFVNLSANVSESPNPILGRKKISITDWPFTIWEEEHDKALLGLLVEQIRNGGRKSLDFGNESWGDMAVRFNESTGFKYADKHLYERFSFYEREYQIVSSIKNHPKFSWDHRRQVVIATDADWKEFVMEKFEAMPYRRRRVPYIDSLEILFADKRESEIVVSNE